MSAPARPRERLEGKVQPWHRDRLAAVYVRQSTAQQVHDHQESTRLQYGLADRAVTLGWAPSRVLVIDEDLGHSASGVDARPGFQRLVSEVGLDHVGIVLGIEMSRLARSGREWHQLLELCALSGTLLGDPDGIYDPADHNDRLLLGLKGTISEAELYLIKQRMWSGRLAKARGGQLDVPRPGGFARRPSGEVVLDPDEQVQAVVRLVFDLFERLGTVNAVLCFLADNRIQLGVRLREGPERGELQWRRPSRAGVQNMLRNPAYAGIYAYGRSTVDPRRRQAGRPFTGRVRTEREDWIVFLPGLLPGYISIEQSERHRQPIDPNPPRPPPLAAAGQGEARRAQVDQIWRQRMERAEFAADRARRQYQLAEPENRLVARQLEKDWETALAERERLGEEYDRFAASRPRILTPAERDQIRALATDIPAIWHAPTTTSADRKQLIRHLVEQVRVEVLGTSEKVNTQVVWAGGHTTTAQISRPLACLTQLSYYPQLAGRARDLADAGLTAAQIASRLNTEGFRPPKRCETFPPRAGGALLQAAGIRRSHTPARAHRPPLAEHEWWLRDLAEHLAMSQVTLDSWIRRGWAAGYLPPEIKLRVGQADPAEVERLRALHQAPRGQHNRRPWLKNQQAGINSDDEAAQEESDEPHI